MVTCLVSKTLPYCFAGGVPASTWLPLLHCRQVTLQSVSDLYWGSWTPRSDPLITFFCRPRDGLRGEVPGQETSVTLGDSLGGWARVWRGHGQFCPGWLLEKHDFSQCYSPGVEQDKVWVERHTERTRCVSAKGLLWPHFSSMFYTEGCSHVGLLTWWLITDVLTHQMEATVGATAIFVLWVIIMLTDWCDHILLSD